MSSDRSEVFTKVRGISHYQKAAKFCKHGTPLNMIREPKNKHDRFAIRLTVYGGLLFPRDHTVGYVSAEIAEQFAPLIDSGLSMSACVLERTGGGFKKRGVNFIIFYSKSEKKEILRLAKEQKLAERKRKAAEAAASIERAKLADEAKAEKRKQRIDATKRGAVKVGRAVRRFVEGPEPD